MKTPDQRGVYGRWLVKQRQDRGWDSAQKALDAMSAVGIRIGKSVYAEYESGTKQPSKNHMPLLERFWGPAPDPAKTVAADDPLVEALRDQTVAISGLVAKLDALAESVAVLLAERIRQEASSRRASRAGSR